MGVSRFKVVDGPWKGQEGEYVSEDGGVIVLRMPGSRAVEFKPEQVEAVSAADAKGEDENADSK